MSFIDVTDVLFDPDIAGQLFTVVRRREGINDHGEGVVAPEVVPDVVGAIFPSGENSLIREVAAQSQANTITVVTTYRLRPASAEKSTGNQFQPDLVYWDGDYYVVWTLNEFTQYGAGFVQAECMTIDYQLEPPHMLAAQSGRVDFTQPSQSGLVAAIVCDPRPPEEFE